MNFSHKLDALQNLARKNADNPNALYLVDLLAEHAEEAEMTEMVLEWVKRMLSKQRHVRVRAYTTSAAARDVHS